MFAVLGKALSFLFGMGGDQSAASNASGLVIHSLAVPAAYYFVKHYNDIIPVTVPLWVIAVIGVFAYVGIEAFRRKIGATS